MKKDTQKGIAFKKGIKFTDKDIQMIFSNPFYAINICPDLAVDHVTMVPEDLWIKSAINEIKEIGAEQFLKNLLENLKGNFV
jgi:hypothetical protein